MKKLLIIIFIINLHILLFAQEEGILPNVIPPSPNAVSIQQYGNTNVSYYTGATNVNIPIYTIQTGSLALPINLNYTASNGVRVNDYSSWVGLGWNLNCGGAVSRTVKGLPDDCIAGSLFTDFTYFDIYPTQTQIDVQLADLELMKNRKLDLEPDAFYYNFNGYSGQFFLDNQGDIISNSENLKIIQRPAKSIKIIALFSEDKSIGLFEIITEDGTIYTFSINEKIVTKNAADNRYENQYDNHISSWYIEKIENYNRTQLIEFKYETISELKTFEDSYYFKDYVSIQKREYETTINDARRISEISFPQGSVKFNYSSHIRKDKKGDICLSSISIRNNKNDLINEFKFDYKYFYQNEIKTLAEVDEIDWTETNKLRLILTSVKDQSKPAYLFEYENSVFLPARNSFAIDHWGFYNGKISNPSLEHKYLISFYNDYNQANESWIYGNADRNSDPNYSIAGILRAIEYPTGGKTTFNYEGNTAVVENNIFLDVCEISGLKIERENVYETLILNSVQKITITNYESNPVDVYIGTNPTVTPAGIELNDNTNNIYEIILNAGTYYIKYINEVPIPDDNAPLGIGIQYLKKTSTPTKKVGGLRIKSIIDETGNGDTYTKRFIFSSGSLVS